jgi:hypothetical protein
MGIHPDHLRELIVKPALRHLDPEIPYTPQAVELLMLTCATETQLGRYLRQLDGDGDSIPEGVALGIFQMEPATWEDHDTWLLLPPNESLDKKLGLGRTAEDMIHDLRYAAQMARIHYWRHPMALPTRADDVDGLAMAYKIIYNTKAGKATVAGATAAYRKLVLGQASSAAG